MTSQVEHSYKARSSESLIFSKLVPTWGGIMENKLQHKIIPSQSDVRELVMRRAWLLLSYLIKKLLIVSMHSGHYLSKVSISSMTLLIEEDRMKHPVLHFCPTSVKRDHSGLIFLISIPSLFSNELNILHLRFCSMF